MANPKIEEIKSILRDLVADVEDLRSSQGLLFERVSPQITMAEALANKSAIAPQVRRLYSKLRKTIEAL